MVRVHKLGSERSCLENMFSALYFLAHGHVMDEMVAEQYLHVPPDAILALAPGR